MKKHTLLFSFMLFFSVLFAQTQTVVKGTVTSARGNDPLIAATVMIQGTTFGTITDDQGKYQLKIPNNIARNLVLVASYTGYENSKVALLVAGTTMMQDFSLEEGAMLGDVIVSANKKAEKVQDVAMSISVLTAKELQRTGATQFRDYASSIPNLAFGTQGGGGAFNDGRTSNQISLRGITGANTTAMYVDETPLPSNIDPRLVDVARIEVLRGPQGSLYGSSTMGGAVKVVTNQPNAAQKEGSAMLTLGQVHEGTYDYGTNAIINLPIVKNKVALRATGFYEQQTGVYDRIANKGVNILNAGDVEAFDSTLNQTIKIPTDNCKTCAPTDKENVDGKISYGFQASLGFYPTKNISIIPKIMYQNLQGQGYDFADISTKNFKQYRSSNVEEKYSDAWKHYSLLANFNFGNGKIVSSTSFTDRTYTEQEDEGQFLSTAILGHSDQSPDFWAGVITRDGRFKKFAQELRYQSQSGNKLNFLAGLYYGNENLIEKGDSKKPGFIRLLTAGVNGLPAEDKDFLNTLQWFDISNDQKIQEAAFFGELYYDLTEKFRLTVGMRYFNATSKRNFSGIGAPYDYNEVTVNQDITDSGLNPKFNLTYKIDATKMFYATISKGYRLGGLNAALPTLWAKPELESLKVPPPTKYSADYLWNYEAGIKSAFADNKLIVNVAAFYNDWRNLQQRRFFPRIGLGYVSNVGAASSKGLELDVNTNFIKSLNLGFGFGLLDAKIEETSSDLDAKVDDRILFTPKMTFSANGQYTRELSGSKQFFVRANLQHVGERYSSFGYKTDPARVLAAYTLVNARIGYVTKRYEIDLFANNLTGEQANFGDVTSLAAETPGRPRYMTNRPRTLGVMLKGYF
jgi:iron complex outermembrane recepter protein